VLGLLGYNVVVTGQISIATMLILFVALTGLAYPITEWLRLQKAMRQANRSAVGIFEFLERKPELHQQVGARFLNPLKEQIALESVTLESRSGRILLDGASVEIPAGARTALLGFEDDSRLALACLIPRLIDPKSGRVLIDGQDLREATLDSIRAQVATVLQADLVFTDSVQDASHRAAFVESRAYALNVRALMHRAIGQDGCTLDTVGAAIASGARTTAERYAVLAPDLKQHEVFRKYWQSDKPTARVLRFVAKRMSFAATLEFGLSSRTDRPRLPDARGPGIGHDRGEIGPGRPALTKGRNHDHRQPGPRLPDHHRPRREPRDRRRGPRHHQRSLQLVGASQGQRQHWRRLGLHVRRAPRPLPRHRRRSPDPPRHRSVSPPRAAQAPATNTDGIIT